MRGRDIRDVADPDFMRMFVFELPIQYVWCNGQIVLGVGRCTEFPFRFWANLVLSHESFNGILAACPAFRPKLLVYARASVSLARFLEDFDDPLQKECSPVRTFRWFPIEPFVIRSATDF